MPIVGRIGRDAGVSGVGGAGVCAQGARAARAGGVLAVDGSADAQGARAGSAAGGSIKRNAAAAATTLSIRHSRFAALPLAKLVASLALHPPLSATEADCAPHQSGYRRPASPQGEALRGGTR